MRHHRLVRGQRIIMAGREYAVEQRIPSGEVQLRDTATNTFVTRSEGEIVDLLFKGHLELLCNEHAEAYTRAKLKGLVDADLTEFSETQRAEVRRKCQYVTKLIGMGVDRKTRKVFEPLIQAIASALGDKEPPSYWQVNRWYTHFISSGESPRAFFPLSSLKGGEAKGVEREVSEIINEAIAHKYLNEQRLPVRAVYDEVVLRIERENSLRTKAGAVEKLLCPCEKTIYNTVAKLDPYEVAKARYGQRYADFKYKPKKEGPRPTRPLQRVEVDHTKLDLFVVDLERRMPIGRAWLTLAIDVYSKCVVGIYIGFIPPSYHSVMKCLKHAMSPKTYLRERYPSIKHTWDAYGIMETVVVDNGREFHSEDLDDACLQLGIVIQYAPVKCPWYKSSVERFFGTLNTGLLHQQPGTTFSNIFQKDEYDSKKNAVISFEVLKEMVHKWIVDVYHQDKHKGLMGIPAIVWNMGIKDFAPALPSSAGEMEIMLGMTDTRVISDTGIELYNLIYNDDNLMSLRRRYKLGVKERVKVKSDPDDLSMIWVQDQFRKTYIPVPAISQSYTQGLNLWSHQVICRYAREQLKLNLNIANLAIAKEEIWQMASAEWNLTKRSGSRQKIARLFNVGRDDHGQIIDQEQDMPYSSSGLAEQPALASDVVVPTPADHPGNGVSSIGTAVNSTGEVFTVDSGSETHTQSDATADAEIGKGDFVTDKTRKRRQNSKKVIAECESCNGTTEKQCNPLTTISVTDKAPDLSGWSVGRMNK